MKIYIFTLISFFGIMAGLVSCKYDKPLKKELVTIWNEDQDIRKQYSDVWYRFGAESHEVDSMAGLMQYSDSLHLIRIESILDERGWLGKDKVGALGNNTLFLIIQHSDLKTQQKYLPIMRVAVKNGKTERRWLALLEDRVALGEGKKQIYGSQIHWDKNSKKSYVAPLEDPDNVDKRRKEVGLESISHYLKDSDLKWNVEEYKKELPELELLDKNLKLGN